MSRIIPIFHGIYGRDNTTYPLGLYLSHGRPATHALTRGGDVPQALLIYVPPTDEPCPVQPCHSTPPSPTTLNDGSTLFEDNADGEA